MVALSKTPDILTTTYLEMTDPSQFNPGYSRAEEVRIQRLERADVGFYRFLYAAVGEKWAWRDRLYLSNKELLEELSRPNVHVYVLYVCGAPAGYIELAKEDDGSVEVVYFGLREEYHGQGLGKHLLSYGVQEAWNMGARRIWLHTCNLDGPHALNNYLRRGFRVFKREQEPMPAIYQ